ncbi:MAG: MgtC/SapB family protein [Vulcanimicrobiota bacterium]
MPEVALKLLTAFVCGLMLGLEREHREKPAGLRTIVLITVGSALFMVASELVGQATEVAARLVSVDPGRVAAGVVSGIGFLGAGSIIESRGSVYGLTTAAAIWVAAAVGLCAGLGYHALALAVTVAVVLVLTLLSPLEDALRKRHQQRQTLELELPNDGLLLRKIEMALREHGVRSEEFEVHHADEHLILDIHHHGGPISHARLADTLSRIERVKGRPVQQKVLRQSGGHPPQD